VVVVVVVLVTGAMVSSGVTDGVTVEVMVSDGVVVVVVVTGVNGSETGGILFSGVKGATGRGEAKEEGGGVNIGSGVIGSGVNGWLED